MQLSDKWILMPAVWMAARLINACGTLRLQVAFMFFHALPLLFECPPDQGCKPEFPAEENGNLLQRVTVVYSSDSCHYSLAADFLLA